MQATYTSLPGGFGSFHSGDVEQLIRQPQGEYVPPPLPLELSPLDTVELSTRIFGTAFRKDFLIDFDRWTFINHGAFGAVVAPVADAAERWRRHCERQPLLHIDRELFPQLVRVIRDVAAFAGAEPQDLVLLPNATTGLNVVISSVVARLGPHAKVYSLDIGYGSVKKMLAVACAKSGADHVVGTVALPVGGPDDIVSVVEATLPSDAALAIFDAVTSNSALALPLARLVALCKERGVPVLIDGAHALGQLPLDIGALSPDYLVANCHKWLCGARGSALLWVSRDRQAGLRPLVVSHGSGRGFLSDFIWDGCRDYTPLLSLSTAVAWWRAIGPTRARDYMHSLLREAVALLCECWGTTAMAPSSMLSAMACVEVPATAAAAAQTRRTQANRQQQQQHAGQDGAHPGDPTDSESVSPDRVVVGPPVSADASWIQDSLHYLHHIEVPVKFLGGRLWVRISAHVYNVLEDYRRLADAVLAIAG